MKGGFDLYGNYYPNELDAMNAEMAQCAEIDRGINEKRFRENKQRSQSVENDVYTMIQHIQYLEERVQKLENTLFKRVLKWMRSELTGK